ncbi:hypothetical protein ES319_D11G362500v1 [Gossypium barbadense]|uniref:Uncharacterized protein n=1 Tax=Gossypium barbadense TaxID=3634 RepID=A0A5J5PLF0_GOSBA|nr:hypothetical protein ES319_D11G362500v1 [Gossypium barbadense]
MKKMKKKKKRRRDCKIPLKISNGPNTTDPTNKPIALTSTPTTTTCIAIKPGRCRGRRFHVGCQHGKLTGHFSFLLHL